MIIKIKNKNSGFTLVEVLTTLSLLLLFTGGFLTLLSQSYIGIFKAGHKSRTIYSSQKEVEKSYSQKSVDEPYEVILNYSSGSKAIKGGLKTVESTEDSQSTTAKTFIPLAPMVELYMLNDPSEKIPAVFQVNNYNTSTVKISCVNFSYLNDNCSVKVTNVNGNEVSFYDVSPSISDGNILNLTFTSAPDIGTYTVSIRNSLNSFEAHGVFTVNPQPISDPG